MHTSRAVRYRSTALLALTSLLFLLLSLTTTVRVGRWIPWESERAALAQRLHAGDLCWIIPRADEGFYPFSWLELLSLKLVGGSTHALVLLVPTLAWAAAGILALSVGVAALSTPSRGALAGLFAITTPTVLFSGVSLTASATSWAPLTITCTLLILAHVRPSASGRWLRTMAIGGFWALAVAGSGWVGVLAPCLLVFFLRGRWDLRVAGVVFAVFATVLAFPVGTFLRNEGLSALIQYLAFLPLTSPDTPFAFDHALRQLAFACFPLVIVVPLLATRPTARDDIDDTPRTPQPDHAFALWMVAVLCAGLPLSVIAESAAIPLALPLAGWAALRWPAGTAVSNDAPSSSRAAYYGVFAAAVGLFVTRRDLKGDASVEGASSSPFLLFESLMPHADATSQMAVVLPGVSAFLVLLLVVVLSTALARSPRFSPLARGAWPALVALFLFWSVLVAHGWYPRTSALFSPRDAIRTLEDAWSPGDRLLSFGVQGHVGEAFLAAHPPERVATLDALEHAWCTSSGRLFALLSPTDLASLVPNLRRRARFRAADCPTGGALYVLNDRSLRAAVISNQPEASPTVPGSYFDDRLYSHRRELPSDVLPVEGVSAGRQLTLVGYRVHRHTRRFRTELHVETYWEVEAPPPRQLRSFVHVETPSRRVRRRFDPSRGRLHPHRWLQGDIVRVDETVVAPPLKSGEAYTIYVGFDVNDHRLTLYPAQPFDRAPLPWTGETDP